jgi:hypothetical protein
VSHPAAVKRKATEKRRKRYEERLGPGVYLPKDDRLKVNAAVEKHLAEKKATSAASRKKRADQRTAAKAAKAAAPPAPPATKK